MKRVHLNCISLFQPKFVYIKLDRRVPVQV